MKLFYLSLFVALLFINSSCKSTKQIYKVIEPKDNAVLIVPVAQADSLDSSLAANNISQIHGYLDKNHIDFKTFSAKIKVDVEDSKGKQPDITATLRMIKDSAIWMSLSATFLNIEVYRVYITMDSVVLMNKQEKEVQYRSLDYLQEVTRIPFDFKTLQDLLVGNPVFFNPDNAAVKKTDNLILLSSVNEFFKTLITLSAETDLMRHSKLDDVDVFRNRTANITYEDYLPTPDFPFATKRHISISEKNKIDIKLNFKQFEFNKELSVAFSVPKNYKEK